MQAVAESNLLPLKVTDLCFSVVTKALLEDINLVLDSAGISAIIGPNGAGKSLFVRLLHGLLKADSGSIHWGGQELDLPIRRRQALVFQKPVLLRRSVGANIDFVLKHQRRTPQLNRTEILRMAGLLKQSRQPARRLSGGEQQRLALARALATEPDVLLLDEPTASLDPSTTQQIESLLEQTRDRGVKLILVTHDIGQARRLASDVVFMHNGRLLEHTLTPDFFTTPSSRQAEAYLDGHLVL